VVSLEGKEHGSRTHGKLAYQLLQTKGSQRAPWRPRVPWACAQCSPILPRSASMHESIGVVAVVGKEEVRTKRGVLHAGGRDGKRDRGRPGAGIA
jgi:hypothetical protein